MATRWRISEGYQPQRSQRTQRNPFEQEETEITEKGILNLLLPLYFCYLLWKSGLLQVVLCDLCVLCGRKEGLSLLYFRHFVATIDRRIASDEAEPAQAATLKYR
jgi:hypothetical protein